MNKKINKLILGLILCSTVIYSGCVSNQPQGQRITELTDIDQHTITKIYIRNGMSGDLTTTNDSIKMEELIDRLDSYSLEKMENQEPIIEYRHFIEFYNSTNKISRITIVDSNIMRIDGIYYDVIDPHIDLETIDELVDSISEQPKDKRLELTEIDQHTITKIYIRNGLSGELTITNESIKIEELIDQLDSYSLEKKNNQESLVGYRYFIDFYSDSNKISRTTIVGPKTMEIDGIYYNVTNPPVDLEAIEKLVDSISEQPQEPRITELTDIDQQTITEISIKNGLSGELTTTNDSIKIEELIEQLDKYSLRIKENQKPIIAHLYIIDFYSNSNKISRIVIIDSFIMRIDGVYYDVIDPHVDLIAIDELVDSM